MSSGSVGELNAADRVLRGPVDNLTELHQRRRLGHWGDVPGKLTVFDPRFHFM